jgi:hypothetical protein
LRVLKPDPRGRKCSKTDVATTYDPLRVLKQLVRAIQEEWRTFRFYDGFFRPAVLNEPGKLAFTVSACEIHHDTRTNAIHFHASAALYRRLCLLAQEYGYRIDDEAFSALFLYADNPWFIWRVWLDRQPHVYYTKFADAARAVREHFGSADLKPIHIDSAQPFWTSEGDGEAQLWRYRYFSASRLRELRIARKLATLAGNAGDVVPREDERARDNTYFVYPFLQSGVVMLYPYIYIFHDGPVYEAVVAKLPVRLPRGMTAVRIFHLSEQKGCQRIL